MPRARINHKLLCIADIRVPDAQQSVEDEVAKRHVNPQAQFGFAGSSGVDALKLIIRRLLEQIRLGTRRLGARKFVTFVDGNEDECYEAAEKFCDLVLASAASIPEQLCVRINYHLSRYTSKTISFHDRGAVLP
jgi:hypothetical protein